MLHDNENNADKRLQIGANFPPEPVEPVPDEKAAAATAEAERSAEDKRVADLIANTNDWATLHPDGSRWTEEIAVEATDYLNQLNKDWNKIEAKRIAERKPLRKQLQAIQDKYLPWLTRIGICRDAIERPHTAYKLAAEQRRKAMAADAARVAAEAQRRADQLAEQAKAGAGGPKAVSQTIIAMEAAEEAERARKAAAEVPLRTQIRGSLGGRTHSLRTVWKAEILEIEKAFEHYKLRREVHELLTRLANADVRNPRLWQNPADRPIPGCYTHSKQV